MAIDNEDIARLNEIYVRKDDCNTLRSETDQRIDSIHEDVAVVKTKLSILIGILTSIAIPVLGIAIKLIFGG